MQPGFKPMITITEQIAIDCSRPELFNFISNYENDTKWRSGVIEMRQSTKGFTKKGTVTRESIKIFGFNSKNLAQVTEFEDNTKLSFKVLKGFTGIFGHRLIREQNGSLVFEYSLSFDLQGAMLFLMKLSKASYRSRIRKDLKKLKKIIEKQEKVLSIAS